MDDEKIFLNEFIELYKSLPSLWKVKSKDYSNRISKNRDYNILVEKLKEKYSEANKEMVIKKINIFRTSYRRELKKQRMSLKSGSGADEEYVPTLWCFNSLGFLSDQEEHVSGRTTMDEETEIEEFETKPKRKKNNPEDNLIKLAVNKLSGSNSDPKESDCLAKSWATQYDKIDESQKLIAQKLISDVLFQGCLKKLHLRHTVQMHNMFNEGSTAEHFNSLSRSSEAVTLKVPTPLSSGASTSSNIVPNSKVKKKNVIYLIESENSETEMNGSFIEQDGSLTNYYEGSNIKNYFSTFDEDDY